ncbi:MAG: ABC transporter ATP-binding protein [Anaerolineales bacterium]|nr:ABC transporter ATP-binding protein [Anaerolineales bacterium]
MSSVALRNITKRFPGVLANDRINFEVKAGEIHTLLGENGAGKTTLMRVLYGLYRPDEGEILINGDPIQILSPNDSIHHGIGMVHQHFMLVPSLTVVENIALGLPSTKGVFLDLDLVNARVSELSSKYNLNVDPDALVWQLSVGEQQRVEILKALYRGADLFILDEPTAVLTPQEVDELFTILRQLCSEGHAIIFISHKLHEVLAISDRITILRDGAVVTTIPKGNTTREELAKLMVGREVLLRVIDTPFEIGESRLVLEDVHALGDKGLPAVRGVNLEVRAGEIVGIAGVSGNGQRELAEAISGLRPSTSGRIYLDQKDVTGKFPDSLIEDGLAYIPEERMRDGVIKAMTVEENLIIENHSKSPLSTGIFLNFKAIARYCDHLIRDFEIKTPSRNTPLGHLSGGNIQKLIMARELDRNPGVLIAAQPTRGVDIGSTEYIHRRLVEQRTAGTATLLISEDLDEVMNLSDRIAVMYEGRIMGIVSREEATIQDLGLMMAGVPISHEA